MSALAVALAAFALEHPNLLVSPDPPVHTPTPTPPTPQPVLSPAIIVSPQPLQLSTRQNEHLAVLLPKHLWKPDTLASQCDYFYCRVRFSIFERRHHCRKCGGVFCSACTSRTTPLLDSSNLDFLLPPRNVPLSSFESPTSPIVPSRVCDDCWDQVHGCPTTPRTPDLIRPSLSRTFSTPISVLKRPLSATTSGDSSLSSSVATPPNGLAVLPPITRKTRSLRTAPSISSLNSNPSCPPRRLTLRTSHLPIPDLDLERSYGELDAYPLKRSSILCKATGGGRWEPKQSPVLVGYRPPVPGGKAPFEVEMEREEAEEKARRENPVVKDGEFQYRFSRDPEPVIMARSPFNLSTF